jgi:hypothetical protein
MCQDSRAGTLETCPIGNLFQNFFLSSEAKIMSITIFFLFPSLKFQFDNPKIIEKTKQQL